MTRRTVNRLFTAVLLSCVVAGDAGMAPAADAPRNLSRVIDPGAMPHRVHVFEDYETEIEKRWWLRGEPVDKDLPPSLSPTTPNRRASRATPSKDFDEKMGDPSLDYKAVVFNPVPGPPMAGRTRLRFRYHLTGTDTLRVQIYSLTNNYHRHLVLTGLPQGQWQTAAVDMTAARRPDGSGGPLSEDERIDDIQFYIGPNPPPIAELRIDDIVLYEAAKEGEHRPFPRRVIFTGWFDTGEQGNEWPGDFQIVPREKPHSWDAARSVAHPMTGKPWLRVHMRGMRTLSRPTELLLRYRASSPGPIRIELANGKTSAHYDAVISEPIANEWTEATVRFDVPANAEGDSIQVDEIRFHPSGIGPLLIDDLLLYEPAAAVRGN